MMDLSQRKEQFSRVYVRAVATVAGFTAYVPEVDDDTSISGSLVALRMTFLVGLESSFS